MGTYISEGIYVLSSVFRVFLLLVVVWGCFGEEILYMGGYFSTLYILYLRPSYGGLFK